MTGLQFFATNRAIETLGEVAAVSGASGNRGFAEDRGARLQLETGGYYFINANEYMSDYFAQVDPTVMPVQAIVTNSKTKVFDEFLANRKIGRVVVCVHGFNVMLNNAVTWFRILTDTMANHGLADAIVLHKEDPKLADPAVPDGSLTAFIGFSWPSQGSVLAYNSDRANAATTAPAFGNLLARLAAYRKNIGLLCHSMGNYMACNALAAMVKRQSVPAAMAEDYLIATFGYDADTARSEAARLRDLVNRNSDDPAVATYLVENYVMIAPDVERRHVTKSFDTKSNRAYTGPFYSALEHTIRKTTNVYSRFDGALAVSTLEKKPKDAALKIGDALAAISPWGILDDLKRDPDQKWEMRLGSTAHPTTAPPSMTSLNATEIAGRPIDHSDHIDVPQLAVAIGKALGVGTPG